MLEVKDSDHQEIIILNRILAAQSTLQVFDRAMNLGDFVASAIQSVPGINFVELTLRSEILALEKAEVLDNQNFYTLVGSLSGKYLPPVTELPGSEILIQLKTFKTTFGFLIISISDPFLFRKYEPAVRNLLNVCALQLENNLHSKIAARYKGHLEELVEEKTAELQNEINEKIEQAEKLRENEERFRSLVENVDDIIYTMDKTGKFTYVSPKWEKWMGHKPEEVIGTTFEHYVHPEDLTKCVEYYKQVFYFKKLPAVLEFRVIKKDGSIRWQASNGSPFYNKNGEVTHIFGIARDITTRKETEHKLRTHMDGLKNSIESKDRYFSVLAHDLRSPFHIFLNLSELLSEGIEHLSKSEIIKLSKQLNIALHKQYELLTDLLDWAGLQSNQLDFNPKTVFLYEEVMKVFDSVSTVAQTKKISLTCEFDGDFEVYADPTILRILLRNLVTNSIKFTLNRGWVKVTAIKKENLIEIAVSDNGVGMDPALTQDILKPDFHTSTPGTNNEKGTGLGLRFCKHAVEKHNGTLRVESEPGVGTTFFITLPNKNTFNWGITALN